MQMVLRITSHCQCGFYATSGKTYPAKIKAKVRAQRDLKKWLPD